MRCRACRPGAARLLPARYYAPLPPRRALPPPPPQRARRCAREPSPALPTRHLTTRTASPSAPRESLRAQSRGPPPPYTRRPVIYKKYGDAQAERAAKRQRHAETRRAQRMLRHNSEAWLSEAQAERAAARNGPEDQKASSSSAAASSVPEQATAMQPPKPKRTRRRPSKNGSARRAAQRARGKEVLSPSTTDAGLY